MRGTMTMIVASLLATGTALADAHTGRMGDYDGDSDAMLSETEFGEAEGNRRFMSYDADGSGDVSEEEFAQGEFRRYDASGDAMVDDAEYGRFMEDGGEED